MPYAQESYLDYTQIKIALKEYLRAQTDFTDYDFEGSVWSNILDVLAYNTYYTAFNTNLVVNELFSDSATLRDNVVALAKQLGYRPKSKVAPKAVVSFQDQFSDISPREILLKKGTAFVTTFNDSLYQYSVVEDFIAPVVNDTAGGSLRLLRCILLLHLLRCHPNHNQILNNKDRKEDDNNGEAEERIHIGLGYFARL